MLKKPTIKEIAEKTNCSLSTVSRVLGGSVYPVEISIKNKIMKEAQTIDYVSPFMRNLDKHKNSKILGVVIPSLSNPYYVNVLRGIEHVCTRHGFSIINTSSNRNKETEISNIKTLLKAGISGMIIVSIIKNNNLLTLLSSRNFPVITFNSTLVPGLSSVTYSYYKATALAIEYLIKKGHKKIAFASGPINRPDREDAFAGYVDTLDKFNINLDKNFILTKEIEKEEGNLSTDLLTGKKIATSISKLKKRPSAIFTMNDTIAFGLITELKKFGIRVPSDISVLGFDDLETSEFFTPSLSTVKQPAFETGELAAEMILKKIKKPHIETQNILLEPTLIERETVSYLNNGE